MNQATDRYGNPFAADLPYARGRFISSTADDLRKLAQAWRHVAAWHAKSGTDDIYNLSGLERRFEAGAEDLMLLDDELAPALHGGRLDELALDHLGGDPARHGVMVFNRQTAAILAAMLTLVSPGQAVIGVSPTYSHPCVLRAAKRAGARFTDAVGIHEFERALGETENVAVVALTRLSVSYELLSVKDMERIVKLSRDAGARIIVDDAGGARVGPAAFDQPKTLAFGAHIGSTGLDKYGTIGPRLGLMAGDRDLVDRMRALAFELGLEARPMLYPAVVRSLEQYRPERVRELIATTKQVTEAMKARFGNRVTETPVIARLEGEDILEMAMERAGLKDRPVMPVEATAALAMILLRDHGILTVHFAAMPPGTAALMVKFVPPETLARFGGAGRLADAWDRSLDALAQVIGDEARFRDLLFGSAESS